MAWIALSPTPTWRTRQLVAPLIVAGVGVSMAIPAAQNSVVGAVAPEAIGKAAGVNSTMRELGGVFGIAIASRSSRARAATRRAGVHRRLQPRRSASSAGFSLLGALAGAALPDARRVSVTARPAMRGRDDERDGTSWSATASQAGREAANAALVRAVYEELGPRHAGGLPVRDAAFDGARFAHVALHDGRRAAPLHAARRVPGLPRATRRAPRRAGRRRDPELIGSYRLLD